jgi:hypothetical protein
MAVAKFSVRDDPVEPCLFANATAPLTKLEIQRLGASPRTTLGLALKEAPQSPYGWVGLVKALAPTQVPQLPPALAFIAENHMKS